MYVGTFAIAKEFNFAAFKNQRLGEGGRFKITNGKGIDHCRVKGTTFMYKYAMVYTVLDIFYFPNLRPL